MISSRSMPVAMNGIISFFWGLIFHYICLHTMFFIHAFLNAPLAYVHVLAVVSSATLYKTIYNKYCLHCAWTWWGTIFSNCRFVWVYAQDWDCWVLWQLYFQFVEETPSCFGCNNLYSHQQCRRALLITYPLQNVFFVGFLNDGHSDVYEVVPHWSLDLHFCNG